MLAKDDLFMKLSELGIPSYRGKQIMHAVYKEGVNSYEQITTLPREMLSGLQNICPIFSLRPLLMKKSKDGMTEKCLFATSDDKRIESVLMNFKDGRHSVCVSSQVGCQLGCKFCATGTMKFGRNLSYEEIADQVLYFAQELHLKGERVSNIIYMGMGEPFMNYENVMKSALLINDKSALGIGARSITISTSGICEGIEKLTEEPLQVNLAVSLHAPNQPLREKIMPIARKYDLAKLMRAIETYIKETHRRVSYEYVMLAGINDSEKEARELAALVKDQLCHINLIPYNATGIAGITGSEKKQIRAFRDVLKQAGVEVTIRVTMGQEIDAACGQLANKAEKNTL